jgi:hypothetical protein
MERRQREAWRVQQLDLAALAANQCAILQAAQTAPDALGREAQIVWSSANGKVGERRLHREDHSGNHHMAREYLGRLSTGRAFWR